MNNRDRLIALLTDHRLERREIAQLLHVSRDTVDRWLAPRETHGREDVPEMAIELLELKLKSGAAEQAGRSPASTGSSGPESSGSPLDG